MRNLVVILLGPTGVGKSSISIELAKDFNAEIISADSIQIYKRLNIGSGKITDVEKQNISHHMIDILEPTEEYSVEEYVKATRELILNICNRKKLPIIVGGTGLYLKSLILNYDFNNTPKNNEIRYKYEQLCNEKGLPYLYGLLKEKWKERALEISANDKKRIIRALEIVENSQNKKEKSNNRQDKNQYLIFALNTDRKVLYNNINNRVDEMFTRGLEEEVKELYDSGLNINNQSMKGIGYKEFIPYFENKIGVEQVKELIKQHSRNYAKRQLTFLRSMENINWIDVSNRELAIKTIKEKINEYVC